MLERATVETHRAKSEWKGQPGGYLKAGGLGYQNPHGVGISRAVRLAQRRRAGPLPKWR